MRLTMARDGVPPGAVSTMSTSPTNVWVSVTSKLTLATFWLRPPTTKVVTRGAPYWGGVPASPSGTVPNPAPGKVCADAEALMATNGTVNSSDFALHNMIAPLNLGRGFRSGSIEALRGSG